jgi:peptide/nickel transport system permease protein
MADAGVEAATGTESTGAAGRRLVLMLWRDKVAFAAALFLIIVIAAALFGPMLLGREAALVNLRGRNAPPFTLGNGWLYVLGADALGRSILARLIVASQNTIGVAAAAVLGSMLVGGMLGLIAGFRGGWVGNVIMRLADVLMSFPSLLLALVVLYVLKPHVANVVIVLAITRIPIYLRTTRAEVLELRERSFVMAGRTMGAGTTHLIRRHIVPMIVPTLVTVASLDFAFVMLAEASLSFLGLGIQPPDITWGLMVAEGRNYLTTAWWLCFWPGLAIMLTTMSLNLFGAWAVTVVDPTQRWRLEAPQAKA